MSSGDDALHGVREGVRSLVGRGEAETREWIEETRGYHRYRVIQRRRRSTVFNTGGRPARRVDPEPIWVSRPGYILQRRGSKCRCTNTQKSSNDYYTTKEILVQIR